MQDINNKKRVLLYIGLGLLVIPVLIAASSLLEIDESGLMTTGLFFMIGLPGLLAGAVLMIISFAIPNKNIARTTLRVEQKKMSVFIKRILIAIIILMLSLPLLYVINVIRVLITGY